MKWQLMNEFPLFHSGRYAKVHLVNHCNFVAKIAFDLETGGKPLMFAISNGVCVSLEHKNCAWKPINIFSAHMQLALRGFVFWALKKWFVPMSKAKRMKYEKWALKHWFPFEGMVYSVWTLEISLLFPEATEWGWLGQLKN